MPLKPRDYVVYCNTYCTGHFRARININSGPRPLRPGPKINIGSRPRPGAAPTSVATTQVAPTDAEQEGNEQAGHPTTADDSESEAQEVSNTDIIGNISWSVICI